jgi:hypothetical protein
MRTLFAAGRTRPAFAEMPAVTHRTYNCTNPDCAEPEDAITVALRWETGVAEVGFLRGWTAGDVVAHCGCVLAEHEVAALAAKAEESANG